MANLVHFDNDRASGFFTSLLLSSNYRKQLIDFVTNTLLGLPPYMTENFFHERMTITKERIKNNIEKQPNLSDADKSKNKALVDTLWPKAEEDLKIQLQREGRMV